MIPNVHFVGSIGLDTTQDVFAAIGETLKPYVKRCPDGEMGGRRLWISWQWPLLRATTFLEPDDGRRFPIGLAPLRTKPATPETEIRFGELGYAREARASYQEFLEARERGLLPATARFQVSLPTPLAVIGTFIVPQHIAQVLPAYEQAMIREARWICSSIPHRDLAIQWDVCVEMIQWDGRLPQLALPPDMEQFFVRQFRRLCGDIPPEVELGFHLCYGDLDAKHFIEPLDLRKAVELANLITSSARRRVSWIHMPVPMVRDDDAYFAPLADLKRDAEMELYLGLVHASDGVQGALNRMQVAKKYAGEFGIATECGMARGRSREIVLELMRVHAGAAQAFHQLP
jgi:hypothetical protein